MQTDAELLRQYACGHDEAAFTELVNRHLRLVYATAFREAGGDATAVQDVCQLVFIQLARKAGSLTLHTALAGWLYTTVRHFSANVRRAQNRRLERERKALLMNDPSAAQMPGPARDAIDDALAGALHELDDRDRSALLLRFFEGKSLQQVGGAIGLSENAARMRVERALGKLRALLMKRGVTSTASCISAVLAAGAVLAPPASLAATVTTMALAEGSLAAAGATFVGATIMTKLKLSIAAAIVVAGVATPLVFQHRSQVRLQRENQALRQQLSEVPNDRAAVTPPAGNSDATSDERLRELLRLRNEVTQLRRDRDELQRQVASISSATSRPVPTPPRPGEVDATWVQNLLNAPPKEQGLAAGTLRGKLLRNEKNFSPSELALRDALLQKELNKTLERSPAEFADFQSAFIQSTLSIADASRVEQIHDIIRQTYEQAVGAGLDIPSKPAVETDDWVQRRFQLDREATRQLKQLLTADERKLFDRAFLGVMGVDLGGVGVDKSNYPKGFLAGE